MQVHAITGSQAQRGPDVCRDHQPTLLAQYQCGIHCRIMPHIASACHKVCTGRGPKPSIPAEAIEWIMQTLNSPSRNALEYRRDSGFIASFATLADTQVGICLIPEIAFSIDGVVEVARQRIKRDGYVVIVVAEGAGQDLLDIAGERDASGNRRPGDIGAFLRDQIGETFRAQGTAANVKYIDPSYMIRSLPANARDANFCLRLGHAAVHAGMAGKTDVVIGTWRRRLTHVPIPLAVSSRKKVDTDSYLWQTVLSVTGQDDDLLNASIGAS